MQKTKEEEKKNGTEKKKQTQEEPPQKEEKIFEHVWSSDLEANLLHHSEQNLLVKFSHECLM